MNERLDNIEKRLSAIEQKLNQSDETEDNFVRDLQSTVAAIKGKLHGDAVSSETNFRRYLFRQL